MTQFGSIIEFSHAGDTLITRNYDGSGRFSRHVATGPDDRDPLYRTVNSSVESPVSSQSYSPIDSLLKALSRLDVEFIGSNGMKAMTPQEFGETIVKNANAILNDHRDLVRQLADAVGIDHYNHPMIVVRSVLGILNTIKARNEETARESSLADVDSTLGRTGVDLHSRSRILNYESIIREITVEIMKSNVLPPSAKAEISGQKLVDAVKRLVQKSNINHDDLTSIGRLIGDAINGDCSVDPILRAFVVKL